MQSAQAEKQLRRSEGILNSMTPAERAKPELLKASRKRRIAAGSGVPVQEVNRLLSQFDQMQGMMKQMKKGGMAKMMRAMGGMKGLGGLKMPGGFKLKWTVGPNASLFQERRAPALRFS